MAQHLPNRPAADAEPLARLTMAQTFVDNRKPYRRMELHAVHPLLLAETDKGPWMAINFAPPRPDRQAATCEALSGRRKLHRTRPLRSHGAPAGAGPVRLGGGLRLIRGARREVLKKRIRKSQALNRGSSCSLAKRSLIRAVRWSAVGRLSASRTISMATSEIWLRSSSSSFSSVLRGGMANTVSWT